MSLNEKLLEEKLAAVEGARPWSPRTIAKLESLVRSADDFGLFRVNPIRFAAEKGEPEAESIDLFLHGARAGLFDMDWMLLCPGCGDVVESFGSLKTLDAQFRCDICHNDFEAALDDRIEVSFTVSRQVREIAFHRPEALPVEDYYFKYQFHQGARLADGTLFADAYRNFLKGMDLLAPGEKRSYRFEAAPGLVAVADRFQHAEFVAPVSGERKDGQRLEVKLKDGKFEPAHAQLAPGTLELEFENLSSRQGSVFLAAYPKAMLEAPKTPLQYDPYLSASRLFSTQTFRNLFRSEVVQGAEGIKVNDLSILFSDLKGSTDLYDRIGDLKAFSLVRRHFDDVGRAIGQNNGAVVKTIGDAVMASFTTPKDAVKAALDMLAVIGRVNAERGSKDLVLKIGIHKGPAIAVTLNDRLDYFGQNINIASRVQAMAEAEEICLTEDVSKAPGVAALLEGSGLEPCKAALRGVQKEIGVCRVRAAKAKVAA